MKELNLEPSPEVGKILKKLFEEVEAKKIENDRDVLLERIRSLA
jgi:hypothetical protein